MTDRQAWMDWLHQMRREEEEKRIRAGMSMTEWLRQVNAEARELRSRRRAANDRRSPETSRPAPDPTTATASTSRPGRGPSVAPGSLSPPPALACCPLAPTHCPFATGSLQRREARAPELVSGHRRPAILRQL